MEHKAVNFVIQGMQSDTAPSRADSKFAYENMNIRMTAMADKTLLAITNEKGNKKLEPKEENSDRDLIISGNYVGHCVVGKYLIIFTTNDDYDRIYRFYLEENTLYGKLIHYNHLNLSEEHPLETLGIYENEEIQKVYWVDGINPIRYINIVNDKYSSLTPDEGKVTTVFDFSGNVPSNQDIEVTKNVTDNGSFAPGVIQYAYSFFDKNGRESAIVDVTSLYYITHTDRGANPEDICRNSFKISISNINNKEFKYDYVRLYAIHRSSINGTPSVRVVADLKLDLTIDINNVSFIDKGTTGAIISPTELLFKGGESIIANTLNSKDNTLFVGNFKHLRSKVSDEIKEALKELNINIGIKEEELLSNEESYYTYKFQLDRSLKDISTFKQGETYRFGIQLQDALGKWSEVIFIKDYTIPYNLYADETKVKLIKPTITIPSNIKSLLSDYIKIRGVVVFPSNVDRTIISQGILCPTVFSMSSRLSNSVFAQSSWFARPMPTEQVDNDSSYFTANQESQGSGLEFRHEHLVPVDNGKFNMEINVVPSNGIGVSDYPNTAWIKTESDIEMFRNQNALYYIDQSILTFHSPEFYFTKEYGAIQEEDIKLKIIGYVPLTAFKSSIDISIQTEGNGPSEIKNYIQPGVLNKSIFGNRATVAGHFFKDSIKDSEDNREFRTFLVFPWHRNGSLNCDLKKSESRTAILKRKVLSNLKFSNNSIFLKEEDHWNAYIENDNINTGITKVNIFDSDSSTIIKIPKPKYSRYSDLIYQANIDTIATGKNYVYGTSLEDFYAETFLQSTLGDDGKNLDKDPVSIKYKSTPHAVFGLNFTKNKETRILPTINGLNKINRTSSPVWYNDYPEKSIEYIGTSQPIGTNVIPIMFIGEYFPEERDLEGVVLDDRLLIYREDLNTYYKIKNNVNSIEDIEWVEHEFEQETYLEYRYSENPNDPDSDDAFKYYKAFPKADTVNSIIQCDNININTGYGGFYLAELYRNIDPTTKFGGDSPEQIEFNIWYPSGKAVSLAGDDNTILEFTEGDTFYQRFDCLKTYPYTNEDQNSIVEIVSFMCENRLNIDGRYDRNRGLLDNTTITNTNFNLYNDVYNQSNNYFNYTTSVSEYDDYINTVIWTFPKSIGEKIDTWTNITLASTLSLDGNKGKLNKIQVHNNDIILFQDKAISKLLFNSRVQIPIADGVPIEIANSGKVDGNVYITHDIGTVNKWSIVSSPNGIYFVDNYNQGIYLFDGNRVQCISDILNMSSFIKTNNSLDPWNPKHFNNIRTFYDGINNDIYFINDKKCLCYSELLGQFTSYFNYENVPMFINLDSKLLSYKDNTLWEQFAGEYNEFYGKIKPFYTTIISNPEPIKDKIFNSIDFRSDTYSDNTLLNRTFDTLEVWNEYQKGKSRLANILGRPSNLKQKFRVWRVQIPRHNNTLQRIRNPWCYIKLSMETPSNYKTVLHDITVNYTV